MTKNTIAKRVYSYPRNIQCSKFKCAIHKLKSKISSTNVCFLCRYVTMFIDKVKAGKTFDFVSTKSFSQTKVRGKRFQTTWCRLSFTEGPWIRRPTK